MTRAPLKLSREMKLLLLLLLMVALIGAWYVWTNSRTTGALPAQGTAPSTTGASEGSAEPEALGAEGNATPAPASGTDAGTPAAGSTPVTETGLSTGNPAAGTVPVTAGSGESAQDGAGTLAVQPNRPVEIEVIPPFPTPEVSGSADADATTPGGINPQASVAAVPSNNPFRPLNLAQSAQAAASEPVTADSAPISSPSDDQGQNDVPFTPVTPSTAGPLALSPIPGAGGSTSVTSGSLSGLPTIPGGDGSTGLASPSSALPGGTAADTTVSGGTPGRTIAGTSGDSGVTVIGGSTGSATSGAAARTTPQGNVVITAPKPPKPIAPPIAGVNVPSVTRVAATPSRPAASASADSATSGAATATGTATSRPVPGTPQVITSLGQDAAEADDTPAAPAVSQLEQFVQKRQLAFNAAVLGPINTAIFRGQNGYVVVAVGQTLPDSQVTVREVNATSAVLSLGTDLKTLELDQR